MPKTNQRKISLLVAGQFNYKTINKDIEAISVAPSSPKHDKSNSFGIL